MAKIRMSFTETMQYDRELDIYCEEDEVDGLVELLDELANSYESDGYKFSDVVDDLRYSQCLKVDASESNFSSPTSHELSCYDIDVRIK